MYNFSALWIRTIWIIILFIISSVCILILGKKYNILLRIIAILVIGVIIFICLLNDGIKGLVNPKINTIEGVFISEARANGISPFEKEYCFSVESKKFYFDIDPISKNKIYNDEITKGNIYIVSYEENTNLIVRIVKKNTES